MFNLQELFIILFFSCLCSVSSLSRVLDFSGQKNEKLLLRRQGYPQMGSNCSVAGPSRYSGKKVMSGKIYLYHIFIGHNGDYSSSSEKVVLLGKFATDVSNSMYAKIMLGYDDTFGNVSSINYVFGGNHFEITSSNTLTDNYIYNVVKNAKGNNTGWNTPVTQSLYLVVFNGFMNYYSNTAKGSWNSANGWCGFHSNDLRTGSSGTLTNDDLVIMPVGDTLQATEKTGCAGLYNGQAGSITGTRGYQYSGAICTPDSNGGCSMKAPNEASVDAIISVYAHEIWESLSNTYGAWFRICDGYENADLCNTNYGIISTSGDSFNGNKINYNLQLNGNNYLVQHNWLRNNSFYKSGTEKCAISADGTEIDNNGLSQVAQYAIFFALFAIPCCFFCMIYMLCCYGNAHGKDTTREIPNVVPDESHVPYGAPEKNSQLPYDKSLTTSVHKQNEKRVHPLPPYNTNDELVMQSMSDMSSSDSKNYNDAPSGNKAFKSSANNNKKQQDYNQNNNTYAVAESKSKHPLVKSVESKAAKAVTGF